MPSEVKREDIENLLTAMMRYPSFRRRVNEIPDDTNEREMMVREWLYDLRNVKLSAFSAVALNLSEHFVSHAPTQGEFLKVVREQNKITPAHLDFKPRGYIELQKDKEVARKALDRLHKLLRERNADDSKDTDV